MALAIAVALAGAAALTQQPRLFFASSLTVLALGAAPLLAPRSLADQQAPAAESFWDAVQRELHRARRYERPLALVKLRFPTAAAAEAAVTELGQLLRADDIVTAEGHDVYAVLPESDRAVAHHLLKRLDADLTATPAWTASSTFPHDGYTIPALRGAVEGLRQAS